jgi:serine protease inhibitor
MISIRRMPVLLLAVVLASAACGTDDPTRTPARLATPSASLVTDPYASTGVSPVPAASAPQDAGLVGAVARTVSDGLRMRSQPRVSDDSIKYEPLLPLGTELQVVGGPVEASGYTWYQVEPLGFALADGVDRAWVAAADHDGTPWIGVAEPAIAGLDQAVSAVSRQPADAKQARAAATAVDAFGIDMYRRMLADPALGLRDRNMVFSPTSIALALGMVRAGAKGTTASQIDDVLHADSQATPGSGLGSLEQLIASRDGTYRDDEGHTHQLALKIANSSFAQKGWPLEPSFLDEIGRTFGSGQKLVDYAADPAAARQTINAWVSRQTEHRIPQLLGNSDVTTDTRLYLVNAVYLKANWVLPFGDGNTTPRPFHRSATAVSDVPTMQLAGGQEVPYLKGDGWRATELRYRGAGSTLPLAMTLIMPDDMAAFEAGLSGKQVGQIAASLAKERTRLTEDVSFGNQPEDCGSYPYSLSLFMPRFSIDTHAQLKELLAGLGMPDAFSAGTADFSGIHRSTGAGDSLYIGNVIHQANIDVDEKGTEAAAATAIGMDTGGCTGPEPAKTVTFRLDHPFFFALRDLETGAILFAGRVVDPSATR